MNNINFIESLVEKTQASQEQTDDFLRIDVDDYKISSPRKFRFPQQERQEHSRPSFQPSLLPQQRALTEREILRVQYRIAKERQIELEKRIDSCSRRFNASYVLPHECKQWRGSKEKKIHCVNDKIRARRAFFQANCPELIGSHRR